MLFVLIIICLNVNDSEMPYFISLRLSILASPRQFLINFVLDEYQGAPVEYDPNMSDPHSAEFQNWESILEPVVSYLSLRAGSHKTSVI